jgi:methionyl-tRNA synthetase
VCEKLDAVDISGALEEIWEAVRRLNRYVQDEEPWKLAKDESAADRLDQVLYALAEGLRTVSVLLHPYMPESAGRLLEALGQEDLSLENAAFGSVGGGAQAGELSPLFPRIEPAAA